MDLHVVAPLASPAEREAVDAVLTPRIGPPRSGWHGGTRDMAADGHIARGGHEARSHRDLLLPALHGIQSRIGFISQPALAYVCRRLTVPPAEAYGVATFYALFATTPRPPLVAHVCDDIACRLAGAEELCAGLERSMGPAGEPALDGRATWLRSPCLGQCERAPAALFTMAGEAPQTAAVAPIDAAGVIRRLERLRTALRPRPATPRPLTCGSPWPRSVGPCRRPATTVCGCSAGSAWSIRRASTTTAATAAIGPSPAPWRSAQDQVIREVSGSKLVGRGGAAFPTGRKWAAVAAQAARPHYLVCNADESEPARSRTEPSSRRTRSRSSRR